MTLREAIDQYLSEQRRLGRINSDRTEIAYRSRLLCHAEDVDNRDPRLTGRDDVKRTLGRWAHPNTQRHAHSVLVSFYDWTTEEELRETNPARQVRRAKRRPVAIQRLTREEVCRMLDASALSSRRERWAIHLGFCAGLRSQELRGLRARHLMRPGWVHVPQEIAKGSRERWVPAVWEVLDVIEEIVTGLEPDHFVLPARRPADPPLNTCWREYPDRPSSPQALWRLVQDVARKAGVTQHVHPHLMRHAFGDHVAKYAGLRAAQELLGHVSVETTASTYVERPTLDELAVSVHGFSYRGLSPVEEAAIPIEAPTGLEPVEPAADDAEPETPDDERRAP